jgi:hypothetical protein
MQIFSVKLGNKEFEVIGIADIAKKTAMFQALVNGVPFAQDEDYQVVRALVFAAVQLNQPDKDVTAQ